MADGFLAELRRKLSQTVDGAWVGKIEAKDALEKAARDSGYAKCLRKAFEEGATRDAYRKCAESANISAAYRKLWGK